MLVCSFSSSSLKEEFQFLLVIAKFVSSEVLGSTQQRLAFAAHELRGLVLFLKIHLHRFPHHRRRRLRSLPTAATYTLCEELNQ